MKKRYYLPLLVLCLLAACKPDPAVPAYIHINSVDFADSTLSYPQGKLSQHISDAWVYVDNKLVGVYQVPATFPFLQTGVKKIQIFGGIIESGQISNRSIYPYFTFYTGSVTLAPNKTTEVTPTPLRYQAFAKFALKEGGEGAGSDIDVNTSNTAVFKKIDRAQDSSVFEGNYSYRADMDPIASYFDLTTQKFYVFPNNNTTGYIELNYKCDEELAIGLDFYDGSGLQQRYFMIKLFPTKTWKKVYVNISSVVGLRTKFAFKPFFVSALSNGNTKSSVYLDNVKIVYQ